MLASLKTLLDIKMEITNLLNNKTCSYSGINQVNDITCTTNKVKKKKEQGEF